MQSRANPGDFMPATYLVDVASRDIEAGPQSVTHMLFESVDHCRVGATRLTEKYKAHDAFRCRHAAGVQVVERGLDRERVSNGDAFSSAFARDILTMHTASSFFTIPIIG